MLDIWDSLIAAIPYLLIFGVTVLFASLLGMLRGLSEHINALHALLEAVRVDIDRVYLLVAEEHSDTQKRKNRPLLYLTPEGELSGNERQEPDLYQEKKFRE